MSILLAIALELDLFGSIQLDFIFSWKLKRIEQFESVKVLLERIIFLSMMCWFRKKHNYFYCLDDYQSTLEHAKILCDILILPIYIHSNANFTCYEQTVHSLFRACEMSIHQATCFLVKLHTITVLINFVWLGLIQYWNQNRTGRTECPSKTRKSLNARTLKYVCIVS